MAVGTLRKKRKYFQISSMLIFFESTRYQATSGLSAANIASSSSGIEGTKDFF